jgi:hypothetical protein
MLAENGFSTSVKRSGNKKAMLQNNGAHSENIAFSCCD